MNDNKSKRVVEMIRAGYRVKDIAKTMKMSKETVHRTFVKVCCRDEKRGVGYVGEFKPIRYYETEEDIKEALSPQYSLNDLSRDELIIYQNLNNEN